MPTEEQPTANLAVDPPGAETPGAKPANFKETVDAGANTASLLVDHGLDLDLGEDDVEVAGALVRSYAADAEQVDRAVTVPRVASLTPASLLITKKILDEYSHQVVRDSVQIRNMVTNKLIEEVDNPDPRVRIRALELLGKISDVGLFTEKREVTVTHQSNDELREKLRQKLQALKDVTPTDGTEVVDYFENG